MKIFFVSLGCDKNLADSECMLGMLTEGGFSITDDETAADIIIINTCCFIGDAKEESINTILEMAEYKKAGTCLVLLVTGCLAQRYPEEIKKEIPEVDAILGTNTQDDILHALTEALAGRPYENFQCMDNLPVLSAKRSVTTGGHFAYLKIAEGCNKRCTYCIIPSVRGRYRSIPLEQLLAQAAGLAKDGVKELILVAQETTLYGLDLYGEKSLYRLLDGLNGIEGITWIRLLYCYPEEIDDQLIAAIRRNHKVCHYLDMPIQHASNELLRRMGRHTTKEDIQSIVEKLRREIPDICLRTTVICGFPGETDSQHEELLDFIEEMKFDRLGAFTYSQEEGTPAAEYDRQVEEEIKLDRKDEVMELVQDIIFEKTQHMEGRMMQAFVEGKLPEENVFVARTYMDAPDIDGYVFVSTDTELLTGDFVNVKITGAVDYDLTADVV